MDIAAGLNTIINANPGIQAYLSGSTIIVKSLIISSLSSSVYCSSLWLNNEFVITFNYTSNFLE